MSYNPAQASLNLHRRGERGRQRIILIITYYLIITTLIGNNRLEPILILNRKPTDCKYRYLGGKRSLMEKDSLR